jgi:hypothetical protein
MKQNLKKYLSKVMPAVDFMRRYIVAIAIVVVVGIFGFLVWRIGVLANAEPSEGAVDEALSTVKRPKIDANAIKSLQDLQAQNVDIQSLFPTNRDNPFQE